MNIRKAFKLMSFAALGILMSCSGEDMPGNITGGNPDDIMTQEIKFYISGGNQPGDIRTRVAPPGSEGGLVDTIPDSCQVDRIRLLTFRRVEGSDDSFVYDAKNSTSDSDNDIKANKGRFTAEDGTPNIEGRVSEAHITKEKGYEYRVIAIGYNTQRKAMNHESTHENSFEKSTINESSLFKIVDKVELQAVTNNPIPAENELKDGISRFEDVSLQLVPLSFEKEAGYITTDQTIRPGGWEHTDKNLTGWYQITPEIFYGSCRSKGSDSEIIKFSDENEITGYLYRGVARLTATVTNISDLPSPFRDTNHVCAIALLADSVRQAVRLSDYENFRTPYFHHGYLPAHYLDGFGVKSSSGDKPIHTFTAIDIDGWVREPEGILGLRTDECHDYRKGSSYTFETFLLPTQTRLYLRYARGWEDNTSHVTETNYGDYLLVVNNKSDGNQATGIIDPVAGGEFVYFRRNYQYALNVDCSIIANNWKELRVK